MANYDEDPSPLPETVHADPVMVNHIIKAMALGMQTAIVPGVTTQADLLSAVFTMLYRMLNTSRDKERSHEEHEKNSQEIGQILGSLLMNFGSSTVH